MAVSAAASGSANGAVAAKPTKRIRVSGYDLGQLVIVAADQVDDPLVCHAGERMRCGFGVSTCR